MTTSALPPVTDPETWRREPDVAPEPERTTAWQPGQYGPDEELGTGGWRRHSARRSNWPVLGAAGGAPSRGTPADGPVPRRPSGAWCRRLRVPGEP